MQPQIAMRIALPALLASILLGVYQVQAPQMARPGPAQQADGITVQGSGAATATSTQATLTLFVASRTNGFLTSASLAPILDALVRAGVQRSDITIPIFLAGNTRSNGATVVARVAHPTLAMLRDGIASLATLSASPDLAVSSAQVRLSLDDCSVTLMAAQAAALHQARMNAQNIARQLSVRLGPVLAVQVNGMQPDADGRCTSEYSLGPYQNQPFASLGDYLMVRVFANVSVRYAIR